MESKINVVAAEAGRRCGMLWCAAWLFTIAFANLVWWKAALALILWPYFLGQTAR
jgi:hypothetical protein